MQRLGLASQTSTLTHQCGHMTVRSPPAPHMVSLLTAGDAAFAHRPARRRPRTLRGQGRGERLESSVFFQCRSSHEILYSFKRKMWVPHIKTKTAYICKRLTLKKDATTHSIAHITIYNKHKHNHHYSHPIPSPPPQHPPPQYTHTHICTHTRLQTF